MEVGWREVEKEEKRSARLGRCTGCIFYMFNFVERIIVEQILLGFKFRAGRR